ncbi:thiazole synthase [Desertibacillus haloalkaliphilus]|uniref:thiazole synthase n=1 Tax=Desertibacillus haloalkaliphilus TaxID=1328930 RepID=UPI001C25767E|nr:thiazole synthase [Desertibacillus haloalkaliphilus]MBU8905814.1 thiazole synthase [Desertibacillus haloalkaliphilus]
MNDQLVIGGKELSSRLFIGTGKYYSDEVIPEVINRSKSEVITVAVRRVDLNRSEQHVMKYIPKEMTLLPNTSGARTAEEAVRIARLARAAGMGNWIKIEVISDQKYLLPDNEETIKATEQLAAEGFVVLPYMSPDLMAAKKLEEAGAAAVMPLGAPIGTNRGLQTKELIKLLISESKVPIIIDAGIGKPSEAAEAMELGAAAVLVNTAIAAAKDPVAMAEAFAQAVEAGRTAYRTGMATKSETANASSPLTSFLDSI